MSIGLLIRILVVILVIRLIWRFLSAVVEGATRDENRRSSRPVPLVRDPVCGTYVLPSRALSVTAADGIHYFCSERCRRAYSGR